MNDAWVVFRPLDVVVFRDGRPFIAGLGASAHTTFPRPTSTAGAMAAVFGGQKPKEITGPLVIDLRPPPTLLFPAPLDIVFDKFDGRRLRPDESLGSFACDLDLAGDADAHVGLVGGTGDATPALVASAELAEYLDGNASDLVDILGRRRLSGYGSALTPETRLGLARQGRAAREGFLYSAEFLRFGDDASGFACRVSFDGEIPDHDDLVRLGGEARQAEVSVLHSDEAVLPSCPDSFTHGRLLLYLATPAIFTRGWIPDPIGDHSFQVAAACLAGPEVAASWTAGNARPNALRWAVAAGSVYYLQFEKDNDARRFACDWHTRCLPQSEERLRTAGFGMCLTGRW